MVYLGYWNDESRQVHFDDQREHRFDLWHRFPTASPGLGWRKGSAGPRSGGVGWPELCGFSATQRHGSVLGTPRARGILVKKINLICKISHQRTCIWHHGSPFLLDWQTLWLSPMCHESFWQVFSCLHLSHEKGIQLTRPLPSAAIPFSSGQLWWNFARWNFATEPPKKIRKVSNFIEPPAVWFDGCTQNLMEDISSQADGREGVTSG